MVGMQDSVLALESLKIGWNTRESLKGTQPQSVAFDHENSNRVYCGTSNDGLWKTNDFGHTWDASVIILLNLALNRATYGYPPAKT
jgi:hypothetical protein